MSAHACEGMTHGPFYSDDPAQQEAAKVICRECPVRATCLQLAIDNHEEGIWGGFDETERRLYMRLYGPVVGDHVRPLDLRAHSGGVLRRDAMTDPAIAFEALRIAQGFFTDCLAHDTLGSPAREYLTSRVTPATWDAGSLGYAPRGYAAQLRPHLSDSIMQDIGLLDERGTEAMAGRVTFPWHSPAGTFVVGLGGRRVDDTRNVPKYANSPDRPWFSKGQHVFGMFRAVSSIQQENLAIIVEGPFDALTMWERGWPNVVATVGAKITLNQLSLAALYADRILVLLDGDEGGRRGIETLTRHLEHDDLIPPKVSVCVGLMPPGKDPAEASEEELTTAIERALPISSLVT